MHKREIGAIYKRDGQYYYWDQIWGAGEIEFGPFESFDCALEDFNIHHIGGDYEQYP